MTRLEALQKIVITAQAHMQGLERSRQAYATDKITLQEFEDASTFWLKVEACVVCDTQMCSAHYTLLYNS